MKLYLETSVLAILTYFKNKEKERYKKVSELVKLCRARNISMLVSFYSLHELFLLPFGYFDKEKS